MAKRTRRDQNVLGKLPRRTGAIQRISWPRSTRAHLVTEVLCVILRRQKHQTARFPLRQTLPEIQRAQQSRSPEKRPEADYFSLIERLLDSSELFRALRKSAWGLFPDKPLYSVTSVLYNEDVEC